MQDTDYVPSYYGRPNLITDTELAEVFPEAKEIIPELLEELELKRVVLTILIKNECERIDSESIDGSYRYFWKKWQELTYGEWKKELDKKIARLERQIRAINGLQPSNGLTDDLIRIAKAVPVESIINRQFRKTGSTLVGLCPFHQERTPSFHIFKSNRGHCFGGCGKGGDVIDIYRVLNDCSFKEAVFALAGGRS